MSFPQRRPFTAELKLQGMGGSSWGSAPDPFMDMPDFPEMDEPVTEPTAAVAAEPAAPPAGQPGQPGPDVLDAIQALRDEIAALRRGDAPEDDDDKEVRVEIARMVRTIARAKNEIAAIKHPMDSDDQMTRASSQLDATVAATEQATNTILSSTETIEGKVRKIFNLVPDDEDVRQLTDDIGADLVTIMEACNFQDLTGQRITKVIKTLRFIEDRILALIGLWGPQAFEDLPVEMPAGDAGEEDELLGGPALANEGISQDEIDALFD